MRRKLARALCLALLLSVVAGAASFGQPGMSASMRSPRGQVSISYFYESLAPYGEWFQDSSYGWCWTPYDEPANWRPYSDGHWTYSDYGWLWVSNEPWGWASYHYGRWFFDDSYGWTWVPGYEWAPAWVAWRSSDDGWVGWAPLPPTARWDDSAGLNYTDSNSIPPDRWSFVPRQHVFDVRLTVQLSPIGRNVTFLGRSRDATRYEVRDGRAANVGLDVTQVESNLGRRVPRVNIVDADKPTRGAGQKVGKNGVAFFRPAVQPSPPDQAPPPAVIQRQQAIPDNMLQRERQAQQRKLESDLKAEQARLARDQKNDLRAPRQGQGQGQVPAADEVRKQHAAEQQAFDAHAAQQRRVLDQRMQKHVVKPGKAKNLGK